MRKGWKYEIIWIVKIKSEHVVYKLKIISLFYSGLPGKLPNLARRSSSSNSEISKTVEFSSITSVIKTCSICQSMGRSLCK